MNSVPIVRLLLRNWLLIGIATLVAGVAGFAYSKTQTPLYNATSYQYFSIAVGQSGAGLGQSANYIQDQMSSFNQLAESPLVLNPVIDELKLDATTKSLARAVVVTTPRDSVIMQISVSFEDPVTAAAIANNIGGALSDAVGLIGPKSVDGDRLVSVRSIQTAIPAIAPYVPNTKQNTAIGLLAGLVLSCGFVILRGRLDNTLRTRQALGQITDIPVIGAVRRTPDLRSKNQVVVTDTASQGADDVRRVRAGLAQLAAGKKSVVFAVTSAIKSEGRSTIAANLAAALAEAGNKTLLVEADLRRPTLASLTSGTGGGLLAALQKPGTADPIQPVEDSGFEVLCAGGEHPNPTVLLASSAMANMLARLRQTYRFVLIDTPALIEFSDATALAGQIDGAVMVVDARRAKSGQVESALSSARLAGLGVLGIVLNQVVGSEVSATQPRATAESAPAAERAPGSTVLARG